MAEFEPVLRTPELGPGESREVTAHGRTLIVLNIGQTYFALDARCPQDGTNLATHGRLNDHLIVCPGDDAAFDVHTGRRIDAPGLPGLRRYTLRVEDNLIQVGEPLET